MNIGFSLVDLALGGAQTFLVQLAAGLAARGHRLSYYLFTARSDPVHAAPALLAAMDAAATRAAAPRALLACDVLQLDGYHSLRRKLPYLSALPRCVETYHSAYSVRRSGPLYAAHRVAISQAVQAALRPPSQVIYYGVPLPPHPVEGERPFDVAILGRLHPVKGHLLFLQACERLFQARGRLSALIIGGHPQPGPYQAQVDGEITRLRRAGLHLQFTGDLPAAEVFDWLQQAQVLLVTSQSEGFGRMALEALACATPVVANPVGGLLEIVDPGRTGFLARRDDPASFAGLAGRLLDDPQQRRQLGHQGRTLVEQKFSLAAMLAAYERLYQQIADAHG